MSVFPSAEPRHNVTATTDPAANNDVLAGYSAGSRRLNTVSGVWWVCNSAAAGAAAWVAMDSTDHPGYLPNGFVLGMDGPTGSGSTSANQLYVHLFLLKARRTITSIFSKVLTGGTASSIKHGLWRSNGAGRPTGIPVLSNNSGVDTTGAGIASQAIGDVVLHPGAYFAGSVSDGSPMAGMLVYGTSQARTTVSSATAAGAMNSSSSGTASLVGYRVPQAFSGDITALDLTGASFFDIPNSNIPVIGLGYSG
jgi:hypothetical protein